MVQLHLEPTEAEILRMVLESYLSDLRMEIANTDSLDYRKKLRERKLTLRKIISEMGRQRPAPVA